jgi:hypothetical protein
MCCDFQEEIAVAPDVDELVFGWLTQREAAENEGARIVTDLLPAMFSLVPDELNGVELFEPPLGDSEGWKNGLQRHKAIDRLGS